MFVAFDLDGCVDSYPREMQSLMSALQAAGHHVEVVTGIQDKQPTQQALDEKAQYLASIGCGQCYDKLVVVNYPAGGKDVANNKVDYLVGAGCHVLVDNTIPNAKAATAAGLLALVPWGAKQK